MIDLHILSLEETNPIRQLKIFLMLILVILCSSCQSEEKPKPESKEIGGGVERILQKGKWITAGKDLKASLQEYIKQSYPGCEILGEMIQFEKDGLYLIVVDLKTEKERKSITVVARMFLKADDSGSYWKIEPFTPEIKSVKEFIDSKSEDRPSSQSN